MLNINRRIFNDETDENEPVVESHNKKIIRQMIIYSPVSSILMVLILIMFIICQITDLVNGKINFALISSSTLIKYGANVNILVNQGQVFRLVTPIFLHGGIIHLFANSSSFFLFLMPVEHRTSSKWLYISVVFLGGILGNMLPDIVGNFRHSPYSGVGASTSICSVMGFDFAYRILRVNNQPLQSRRILVSIFYLFIISMMPGIDFFGHFGSLIAGFLFGFSFLKGSYQYLGQSAKIIRIAGLIGLFSYSLALVVMLIKSGKDFLTLYKPTN